MRTNRATASGCCATGAATPSTWWTVTECSTAVRSWTTTRGAWSSTWKNIDRFEWFAEKATEIGVDVISPVFGDYSERRIFKPERIERLLVSAAKQSHKGAIPRLDEAVSVADFLRQDHDGLKLICYCFDDVERKQIQQLLPAREICILIGPEGDFSPEEAALARERGWVPVSLGESRLRTETAAVVAATAVYLYSAV